MRILGIETSCDETAAAVVVNNNNRINVLSNVVSSSQDLHIKYGGILPEEAAREQLKMIIPVIDQALLKANCRPDQIDAIAVTDGPGLVGSLLVGVETAKTLSLLWQKPLIPVNHLLAHFYANWISSKPSFPLIGLLVSGGHTDLVLMTDHGKYKHLGGTRDDAAGECFDKCARLLGLPYPGGPNLSKIAENGNPKAHSLPRPMWDSNDYDFSFSGLKTAVANLIPNLSDNCAEMKAQQASDLAASIEQSIVDVLLKKVALAALEYKVEQIMFAGGVASNRKLRESASRTLNYQLFIPDPPLCTDNAVTTATAALFLQQVVPATDLQVEPGKHL